jgi:hypothetical protein
MKRVTRNEVKRLASDINLRMIIDGLWRDPLWLYDEKLCSYADRNKAILTHEDYDPRYVFTRNTITPETSYAAGVGFGNTFEADFAQVYGFGNTANSFMETVFGPYALIDLEQTPDAWINTDLLYLFGCGSGVGETPRANALEIYKSGLIKAFNAFVIGEFVHQAGEVPGIPEIGTIQYTPENGFEGYHIDEWISLGGGVAGHDPVTIASGSQTILGLNGQEISINLEDFAKANHEHAHSSLNNLGWTISGHTGTANKLAGFNATGAATVYDMPSGGVDLFIDLLDTPESWEAPGPIDTTEWGLQVGRNVDNSYMVMFSPIYGSYAPDFGGWLWVRSHCPEVEGEICCDHGQIRGKDFNGVKKAFEVNWRGLSLYIGNGAGLGAYPVDGNTVLAPYGFVNIIDGEDNTGIGSGVGNGIFHSSGNILIGAGADIIDDGLDGYLCINLGGIDVIRGYASKIEFAGALTFNGDDEFEIMTLPTDAVPAWYNSLGFHNSAMIATGAHQMGYTPYSLPTTAPSVANSAIVFDEHGFASWGLGLPVGGTLGDMLYHDGDGWVLLDAGTEQQALKMSTGQNTVPQWKTEWVSGASSDEYLAVNPDGEEDPDIASIGINCLPGLHALRVVGLLHQQWAVDIDGNACENYGGLRVSGLSYFNAINGSTITARENFYLKKVATSNFLTFIHDVSEGDDIERFSVDKDGNVNLYSSLQKQGVNYILDEFLSTNIQAASVGDIPTIVDLGGGVNGVSWAEFSLPSDVMVDGDFTSNGLMKRTGAGTYGIVTDNSALWNALKSLGQVDHEICTQSYYDGLGTGRPSKFYFIPE